MTNCIIDIRHEAVSLSYLECLSVMLAQVFLISIMITGYLKDIRVSALLHNGLSISLFLTESHQLNPVVTECKMSHYHMELGWLKLNCILDLLSDEELEIDYYLCTWELIYSLINVINSIMLKVKVIRMMKLPGHDFTFYWNWNGQIT